MNKNTINLQSILTIEANAILEFANHIENDKEVNDHIQILINHIASASPTRRMIIMGVGKNSAIAKKTAETWASIGIPSFYTNIGHMLHGDLGMIQPEDVIIYLSRSGNTVEMNDVAEYINSRYKNPTFAITCNKDAGIASLVNIHIYTQKVKEADQFNLAPSTTSTLILAMMDSFGIVASQLRGFKKEDFLFLHPGGSLGNRLRTELAPK